MILLTTLFLTGCVFANIDSGNNLNEEISSLSDKLPTDLTNKLPAINASDVPSAEDVEKLFKEKCRKLTHDDKAYEAAVMAKDNLEVCVKSLVNMTEIQQEIEDAKPTGDLDSVFGKYCRKTPVAIQCIKTFLNATDPCLEEKEKADKRIIVNMTESMIDFLCYKDGDRIAMFIAEGGFECISEQQDAIQVCVNETLGKRIPSEMPTIDSMPLFVIDKEQCNDLSALQTCVVKKLEDCSEPTPANIINSLFDFIKKATPCSKLTAGDNPKTGGKNPKSAQSSPNMASTALLSTTVMVTATLFVRYF